MERDLPRSVTMTGMGAEIHPEMLLMEVADVPLTIFVVRAGMATSTVLRLINF